MLELSTFGDWRPPILETVASTGQGVAELWGELGRHRLIRFRSVSFEIHLLNCSFREVSFQALRNEIPRAPPRRTIWPYGSSVGPG